MQNKKPDGYPSGLESALSLFPTPALPGSGTVTPNQITNARILIQYVVTQGIISAAEGSTPLLFRNYECAFNSNRIIFLFFTVVKIIFSLPCLRECHGNTGFWGWDALLNSRVPPQRVSTHWRIYRTLSKAVRHFRVQSDPLTLPLSAQSFCVNIRDFRASGKV